MNIFHKIKFRKDIVWVIILSVIVLLPNLYLFFYGSDLSGNFMKKMAYLCISLVVFFFPSIFLKAKYFFLFESIFVLLSPIEIAHIYLNKMPLTNGFLMAIIDTDWGEAMEVLSSLKSVIVVFLIIYIAYFYICIKKIDNTFFVKSKKLRLVVLISFILLFAAGFGYYYFLSRKITSVKEETLSMATYSFTKKFDKIYPCNLIITTSRILKVKNDIKQIEKNLQDITLNAGKTEKINGKEIYLFVIGETARYSSFSINGYGRKTSPLLEKIPELISFSDYYSEANLTSSCLPLMLTQATPGTYNDYYGMKSFVDAFKEAGFKTYWIANQSAGNTFVRRISRDADGEYFSTTDFDAVENYDENLWNYLEKILEKNEDKVFIVLHTLGSHFRYNFRYPEEYDVFRPSFKGAFDYSLINKDNKELLVNTYDNSILYTDYFLAGTIEKIKDLNAVSYLIYTSDHGENLFDDERNMVLHANAIPTEYDVHVPFIIWTSEKYRNIYPEKQQTLLSNKNSKLNSSNLFYTVLDMADIDFDGQNLQKSFSSDSFQSDSVRYILKTDLKVMKIGE